MRRAPAASRRKCRTQLDPLVRQLDDERVVRGDDDCRPHSRASRESSDATPSAFASSRRDVGSSAIRTSGRGARARAIATRKRSPPDSRSTRCSARSASPTASSAGSAPSTWAAVEPQAQLDVLARAQERNELGLLRDVPDVRAPKSGASCSIERRDVDPQELDRALRPEARDPRRGRAASSCRSPRGR